LFAERNMTEIDAKKSQETWWLRQYTLTPEQVKRLIEDKLKRAKVMHQVEKRQKQIILDDA
jgi:hypothetical protein